MNFEEVFNEAKKLNNNDVPSLGDVVETVFTYNKRIAKFFAIANVKELGDFDSDAIDEIRDVYNQGLNDDGVDAVDGNLKTVYNYDGYCGKLGYFCYE